MTPFTSPLNAFARSRTRGASCSLSPKRLPPEQQIDVMGAVGELMRLGKTNTTEALTKATGGATLSFSRQKALEEAIQQFGIELHSQYVISFAPDAPGAGLPRH